jgi:DNA-binding IclR family transcriptional regulator
MTTYKRIEAVKKAADILKYMGHRKEPVTGADVAQAIGIPVGTAMCHLVTLEDGGFVESIGDRYMIGRQVALVWARVKSNLEAQRDKINSDLDALNPENYQGVDNGN